MGFIVSKISPLSTKNVTVSKKVPKFFDESHKHKENRVYLFSIQDRMSAEFLAFGKNFRMPIFVLKS